MAKINHSFDNVIKDKHPVIIVSNWKTCVKKTGTINVIPITSTLDNFKSDIHVEIEGYGLHKSKILCNQILTIDKSALEFKIGEITDIDKIEEIERALKVQLSLDSKYKNIDLDLIEQSFTRGLNMGIDYKFLKGKILEVYLVNKNYAKSIEFCNQLLDVAQTDNNDLMWFSYYMLSLNYIKLKDYDKSLEQCKVMFKYLDVNFISNYNMSMMCLATCYLNLNQTDKAVDIYKQIVKYSRKYNIFSLRIVNLWNICRIKKDINKMQKLIKILENHTYNNNLWDIDYSKEEILQNMNVELQQAL